MVTSVELVRDIDHGDGIRGFLWEIYYINTNCEKYLKWETGLQSGGRLADLGRINEFKYLNSGEGSESINVEARVYTFSPPVEWVFNERKSFIQRVDCTKSVVKMGHYSRTVKKTSNKKHSRNEMWKEL